jgi:hypothetical protein
MSMVSLPSVPGGNNVANLYPNMAWAVNDAELGPILQQAAQNGWTAAELQAALFTTSFWQQLSDNARQLRVLQETDPATFREQIQNSAFAIHSLAIQMGLEYSYQQAEQLAKSAAAYGWDRARIQSELAHSANFASGAPLIQQVKQMYSQFMIPISDQAAADWAKRIGSGTYTTENLQATLLETAKKLYPGVADAIDRGIMPGELFEPYKQIAVQELGINPEAIDPSDTKWSRALNMQTGDFMNFEDWKRTLRTDPQYGWDHTEAAAQQAAEFTTAFGQNFGLLG